MKNKEYNRISLPYQFLTKRFDLNQTYTYEEFHKCYNPKHYGVKGENLEVLRNFETIMFKQLFTEKHLKENSYSTQYLDSLLIKIEEKRICVHMELGQIFLYLLISKFEKGINQFLLLIDKLLKEHKGLIRLKDDNTKVIMNIDVFNSFNEQFEQIENYSLIFHLFAMTNSGYIMRDWNGNVEIYIRRINKLLETLKIFDFSKIEL